MMSQTNRNRSGFCSSSKIFPPQTIQVLLKAGWYAVLEDPQMPATSTLLDQAHNAIERKLFSMKGFHHPGGSQATFLTGLAHLYNLIPYQRRAKNAGLCGVEVEGGRVPTQDWMLNLQILTSGGYQCAAETPHH
jgi:hypothetical protein